MAREISKKESDKIKEIVQLRKIKHLVHFTHMENLPSILTHGLLGRTELRNRGIQPQCSNHYAIRNVPHAISCSITFPNTLMLSSMAGNANRQWVVLAIDAQVLWTKPCAFCEHNALSSEIDLLDIESRMGSSALEREMFPEDTTIFDKRRRRNWTKRRKPPGKQAIPLRDNYTTDVQAEVLVLDQITPELFVNCYHRKNIPDDLKKIANSPFFEEREYFFVERDDSASWGDK